MTISWSCSISQFWICLWTFVLSLYGLGFLRFSIIVFSLLGFWLRWGFWVKSSALFWYFDRIFSGGHGKCYFGYCRASLCVVFLWTIYLKHLGIWLSFFHHFFFMGFMLSGLGTICMIKLIWQTFIHVEFSYLWIGFAFIGLFMSFSVYFGWILFGIPLDPLLATHFQISKEFAFHSFFFLVFMWLA